MECLFFKGYFMWSGFAKSRKESTRDRARINTDLARLIRIIIYSILRVLDSIRICPFHTDGILLKRLSMPEIHSFKFSLHSGNELSSFLMNITESWLFPPQNVLTSFLVHNCVYWLSACPNEISNETPL